MNCAAAGLKDAIGYVLPRQHGLAQAVIGVVTDGHRESQICQLTRSIEIASVPLAEQNVGLQVLTTDNAEAVAWSTTNLPIDKLPSSGKVGFAQAMNRLMARAFADSNTVWFVCAQAGGVFHRGALARLAAAASANPQALIEARQFPQEHAKRYDPVTGDTPWACGACLLVSRAVYEAIGGFDPVFIRYLEDVDLSWRARRAGFAVKVCGDALFGHAAAQREPTDVAGERHLLLSGRYLAFKWGDEPTWRWAEEKLITGGHFADRDALPTLPNVGPWENRNPEGIADFSRFFWFAPTRWQQE